MVIHRLRVADDQRILPRGVSHQDHRFYVYDMNTVDSKNYFSITAVRDTA